jgi:hypothetical protein
MADERGTEGFERRRSTAGSGQRRGSDASPSRVADRLCWSRSTPTRSPAIRRLGSAVSEQYRTQPGHRWLPGDGGSAASARVRQEPARPGSRAPIFEPGPVDFAADFWAALARWTFAATGQGRVHRPARAFEMPRLRGGMIPIPCLVADASGYDPLLRRWVTHHTP